MPKHYELTLRIYQDDKFDKACDYRSKTDRVELGYDLSFSDADLFVGMARNVHHAVQYNQMLQIVPEGTQAVAVDAPSPSTPAQVLVEPPTPDANTGSLSVDDILM